MHHCHSPVIFRHLCLRGITLIDIIDVGILVGSESTTQIIQEKDQLTITSCKPPALLISKNVAFKF